MVSQFQPQPPIYITLKEMMWLCFILEKVLHMLPCIPNQKSFRRILSGIKKLKPKKLENTMTFMFESRFPQHLTEFAAKEAPRQDDYAECWTGLEKKFNGTPEGNW